MLTREHLAHLSKPFHPTHHEFHPFTNFVYIKERAICGRIESVDSQWEFEVLNESHIVLGDNFQVTITAKMTIKGVSRTNTGTADVRTTKNGGFANEAVKSATTDALKRCARLFGVGRYLLDAKGSPDEVNQWLDKLYKKSQDKVVDMPTPQSSPPQKTSEPDNVVQAPWSKSRVEKLMLNTVYDGNEWACRNSIAKHVERINNDPTMEDITDQTITGKVAGLILISKLQDQGVDINQLSDFKRYLMRGGVQLSLSQFIAVDGEDLGTAYRKVIEQDQATKSLTNEQNRI